MSYFPLADEGGQQPTLVMPVNENGRNGAVLSESSEEVENDYFEAVEREKAAKLTIVESDMAEEDKVTESRERQTEMKEEVGGERKEAKGADGGQERGRAGKSKKRPLSLLKSQSDRTLRF